jgi:hypothetical protein
MGMHIHGMIGPFMIIGDVRNSNNVPFLNGPLAQTCNCLHCALMVPSCLWNHWGIKVDLYELLVGIGS